MSILDVDLRRFETGTRPERRAVVDGVLESLETGFVYLRHGLSSDFLDECYEQLGAFFALPIRDKETLQVPGSRGQRGYTGRLIETAASSERADWKEMLNWGSAAPDGHPLGLRFPDRYPPPVFPEKQLPGISDLLMQFHDQVLDVQRRFLRIVALGLGARTDFFDRMTQHGATLTRAAYYPPMAEAPDQNHVWAAEHGDINLVTALPRATAPGLQVSTADGWIDAVAPEGSAILNTGLMLEHFSNGRLPTGIHRVVADREQEGGRIAVVQFCHPTPSTILSPLASCITPDRPQAFGAVSAADRLDEVLWEINLAQRPD